MRHSGDRVDPARSLRASSGSAADRSLETSVKNVYDPAEIEARWQAYWQEHETFRTPNPGDPD